MSNHDPAWRPYDLCTVFEVAEGFLQRVLEDLEVKLQKPTPSAADMEALKADRERLLSLQACLSNFRNRFRTASATPVAARDD